MRPAVIVLCFALVLSACGARSGSAPPPAATSAPTATQSAANPLAGTAWTLVTLDGAAVPPEPVVRLEFGDDEASGFAGCNFLGGFYTADDTTVRLNDVAQTAMMCEDDAAMRQESAFTAALWATVRYVIQGDTLELRDQSGATRLVFRAQRRETVDPTRLHNTRWQLESMAGEAPSGERPITLALAADGTATGDAGCRTFGASWQAEADSIDFPMIEMLEETCADQELLLQEGAYTDALSTAHAYRIVDGKLELLADRNGPLRFAPLP